MTHTTRTTRFTLMPDTAARSALSATARVALPNRVRWSINPTATRATMMTTMVVISRGVTAHGPNSHRSCTWKSR